MYGDEEQVTYGQEGEWAEEEGEEDYIDTNVEDYPEMQNYQVINAEQHFMYPNESGDLRSDQIED